MIRSLGEWSNVVSSRSSSKSVQKQTVGRIELESGSRRALASRIRAEIARRGMEEPGLSAAEIARHLGVATSSITRAVARLRSQVATERR